ncbi:MAG: glycosyltransferase family 4 protein [Candidatus Parcubacteria bacterium]|nr:glycosyltransferase family 4 protein [Candidatus Parcubacteria bacterium]
MNILFFSRLFYPHIGGVEKHVLEVSRLLVKKGHKVTIITEQYSQKITLKENVEGLEIIRIPQLKDGKLKKFKIWKWLWINRKFISDADTIHCHDVFFWYLPFRFLYFHKKVFTTFHGYESYPLTFKLFLARKIAEKLSTGNICIGDFIKKWYGTKPSFVSYGGVNKVQSSKFKVQGSNSAVFIGRLDEQTGIKTYINAVNLIRKKNPDFQFEIIGDGKFRQEIEKNFKILGFKNNPERYFENYQFAFVSRYLSMLEAMAAKRLVFAVYDNPLKEDYLKMAPFSKYIVISGSSPDLVSKISFYTDNMGEREKMIDKAYTWVKKNTWEEVVSTYLNLWRI